MNDNFTCLYHNAFTRPEGKLIEILRLVHTAPRTAAVERILYRIGLKEITHEPTRPRGRVVSFSTAALLGAVC